MTGAFAQVALPLPLAEPYTYHVPPALADRALPGARVVVPVRSRELIGIVTAVNAAPPPGEPRDILAAPDSLPAVPGELLELAAQVARYYGSAPGLVLRSMLPAALWGESVVQMVVTAPRQAAIGGTAGQLLEWLAARGGEASVAVASRHFKRPMWDVADRLQRVGALTLDVISPDTRAAAATTRVASLAGDPLPLLERERRFARSPKQGAIYSALEAHVGPMTVRELLAAAQSTDGPLRALVEAGVITIEELPVERDPFAAHPVSPPPETITAMQADALAAIDAIGPGDAALLFGVTGSGKTLVYLHHIRRMLEAGRGAIILVPEIALTPQTVSRVRGMFGDSVAVLHSGLSDGERADAWRQLRRGERRVAVGARSAVFAPVRDLGVIVLDEEHEASYKNGETPRYHAREVAAMRAHNRGRAADTRIGNAVARKLGAPGACRTCHPPRGAHRQPSDAARRTRRPADRRASRRCGCPTMDRGTRRRRDGRACPRGAGAVVVESPRVGCVPAVPRVRRRGRMPELQHLPHGAPPSRGTALPLLRPPRIAPGVMRAVWRWNEPDGGGGHSAARAADGRAFSSGQARSDGSRHHHREVGAPPDTRTGRVVVKSTSSWAPR